MFVLFVGLMIFFNVIKCYTKCQTIARQLLQQWDTLIPSHHSSENFKLYSVLFHHCKLYTYILTVLYIFLYTIETKFTVHLHRTRRSSSSP